MRDWTGDTQAVMATLNASSHSDGERETNDYYATPPAAVDKLLEKEILSKLILEPACGQWHISMTLENHWKEVVSYDLIDRWYGWQINFLSNDFMNEWSWDIVTNPPFSMAQEFVEKSLSIIWEGKKVCMLLRIQFLEWVKRNKFFQENPPRKVYVFSRNIRCAMNRAMETDTIVREEIPGDIWKKMGCWLPFLW